MRHRCVQLKNKMTIKHHAVKLLSHYLRKKLLNALWEGVRYHQGEINYLKLKENKN